MIAGQAGPYGREHQLSADGNYIYVMNRKSWISKVRLSDYAVESTAITDLVGRSFWISPDGKYAVVSGEVSLKVVEW